MSLGLAQARYYHATGDHTKALSLARSSLTEIDHLTRSLEPDVAKKVLTKALEIFDTIAHNKALPLQTHIELITSKFNGRILPPWLDFDPIFEEFAHGDYTDPDGPPSALNVAKFQGIRFSRLSELSLSKNPDKEMFIPGDVVSQVSLANCSMVVAIIVALSFEAREDQIIISKALYPQKNGKPVVSPSGHYVAKLWLGGTLRRVDIDEMVPVSEDREDRCYFVRTKKGSLGPVLLEKAFLKAMGGYAFKGSHAAFDINVLTGWIPVSYYLPLFSKYYKVFSYEGLFVLLHKLWLDGHVLLSLGTGPETCAELEPNHDYAVLAIGDSPPGCEVANPWNSHLVFYEWSEISHMFNMLYVNIKPDMMPLILREHRLVRVVNHKASGFGRLVQYTLNNTSSNPVTACLGSTLKQVGTDQKRPFFSWRTYNTKNRIIADNQTLLTSKTHDADALYATTFFLIPARSCWTSVLTISDVSPETESLALTISCRAKTELEVYRAVPPKHSKALTGHTNIAASRYGSDFYQDNTQFSLQVLKPCKWLQIHLLFDQLVESHLAVYWTANGAKALDHPKHSDILAVTDEYRAGVRQLRLDFVRPGNYIVIPSLYNPDRLPFRIEIDGAEEFDLKLLSSLNAGLFKRECLFEWKENQTKATFRFVSSGASTIPEAKLRILSMKYSLKAKILQNSGTFEIIDPKIDTKVTLNESSRLIVERRVKGQGQLMVILFSSQIVEPTPVETDCC